MTGENANYVAVMCVQCGKVQGSNIGCPLCNSYKLHEPIMTITPIDSETYKEVKALREEVDSITNILNHILGILESQQKRNDNCKKFVTGR